MSVHNPLDSPADLQSTLPLQLLVLLAGLVLVFIEGAFARWSVFYASVPLPTIAFIFFMRLNSPHLLSLGAVMAMGLFGELMFFDMLGARSTALMLVALLTSFQAANLQHGEFIDIWSNFCLTVGVYFIFRIAVFFVFYLSFPDWNALFFQAGLTMMLFPLFFVVMTSASHPLSRLLQTDTG